MPTSYQSEICFHSATRLAAMIRRKEISGRELMELHLAQVAAWNPRVNAIVTLTREEAVANAIRADEVVASGVDLGPLHGLPVAHKDLVNTAGIRTTYGSRIYQDFVPTEDDLIVQRFRQGGAICVGKTNTPEFGAGSQTFNEVFGATRNPYNLEKTCGGSSGGAAVALACGMIPIADGSDFGGSLRNPAAFCNVVGFRPSAGLVPNWPSELPWFTVAVKGPMARTVEDIALILTAIAGPDDRSPISLTAPASRFAEPLQLDPQKMRVAYSPDLNGIPVEPAVAAVVDEAVDRLSEIGCKVELNDPDLDGADEVFQTIRAWRFHHRLHELLAEHPSLFKDTIKWNVEKGATLTGLDVARQEQLRGQIHQRMVEFFQEYDFLVLPVTQVAPFDVTKPYVEQIAGRKMETYIDWMKSCYLISTTGLPAISVPAGFTPDGLPVGLQIVGRFRQDFAVLQIAHAFEQTRPWGPRPG